MNLHHRENFIAVCLVSACRMSPGNHWAASWQAIWDTLASHTGSTLDTALKNAVALPRSGSITQVARKGGRSL